MAASLVRDPNEGKCTGDQGGSGLSANIGAGYPANRTR
jgi:hypothetical protein